MRPSVIAFTNGNLNIIDTRENCGSRLPLYKQRNLGELIKWNPIVPYWIAAASSNVLNFYDIRYNSCSPVLSINHSNVNSICWSPINSDLILAASSDRRVNLWSMSKGQEDCRLGMKMNRFEIGSLIASKDQSHVYYGLDDADSIVKIKIRSEYLSHLAPNYFNSEYQDIEEALYSSDYTSFKTKLSEISNETLELGNYSKLKQLVLLATPSKSETLKFDEKCLSSIEIKKDVKEFRELLKQSTSFTFKAPFGIKESEETQKFVDQMRLKIRIVELLAKQDFESLEMFLNLIISSFSTDLNYLNKNQSIKLMALLLKNDRKSAYNFLSKIISANPFGTPEIIQIWIWMFCYPTIFDQKSFELIKIRPSLSKSVYEIELEIDEGEEDSFDEDLKIEKCLERMRIQFYDSLILNQKIGQQNIKIIHQLFLNLGTNPINFDHLIDTSETVLKQIHAALLDEKGNVFILSAETIKLLLEAALRYSSKSFLNEFFLISFRLQVLTEKTPIYSGIQEFINSVGFSRLKFLLNKCHDDSSITRAINSIITIGSDQYSTLSEDQLNYLAEYLHSSIGKITNLSSICVNFRIDEMKSSKFKLELLNLINLLK